MFRLRRTTGVSSVSESVALLLSAASLGVYYSDLITTALEARRAARARQIELVPPKADAC